MNARIVVLALCLMPFAINTRAQTMGEYVQSINKNDSPNEYKAQSIAFLCGVQVGRIEVTARLPGGTENIKGLRKRDLNETCRMLQRRHNSDDDLWEGVPQ